MRRVHLLFLCVLMGVAGTVRAQEAVLKLSLAEAIERARSSAPRLRQLSSSSDAARAGIRGAEAGHWPSVNLQAGYTRNSDVPEELTAPLGGGPPVTIYPNLPDQYRTRVEATLPVFAGGRTSSSVDAAKSQERAVNADLRTGNADLTLETTAAYWNLVTASETRRVLSEALAAYDAHLKDASNRKKVGMAAANEVLQVQVERDQAELTLIRAKNAEQVSDVNLRRLIGYPSASAIRPTDSLEEQVPDVGAGGDFIEKALASRPERAALKARLEAAEAVVSFQKAGWWPQVNAVGGYDYSNPNRKIFPAKDEFHGTWDVGVNLTMNLFEGGRTQAGVDQAKAQAESLRQQLRDLDERVRFDVESRLLNLHSAVAAVPVAERTIEAATENVAVAKNRYRSGVIPSSELLDAETALLKAGLLRADVLARVRIARAELTRAVGE